MTVGAASRRAGARVVEHGDEGVGRVADHSLQVEAVLREGRDGQGALPAGSRWQPRAWEARVCRMMREEEGAHSTAVNMKTM